MSQLSDQELQALFAGGESEQVEFCQSPDSRAKIAEAVCAFANDMPDSKKPGVLFIGVKDDGACARLSVTDQMLQQITHIKYSGKLAPLPVMSVRKAVLNQCEMIAVEIQPSLNPPIRFEGRCFIRAGPTVRQASYEEETRLSEKRRGMDLPFDMRGISGASFDLDLNMDYFKGQYLPSAVSSEILAANDRDLKNQMISLRLLNQEGFPTAAALIVMGKDPRRFLPCAYIQFIRFEGRKMTDPVRTQEEISGPAPDQIRQIEMILKANISKPLALTDTVHVQSADYPFAALSQLVRNAVLHRDYESRAPVFIRWFSDRVEIQSPGGPHGGANKDNFGKEGIVSHRNPTLAEALKNLGFVESFGFGVFKAYEKQR